MARGVGFQVASAASAARAHLKNMAHHGVDIFLRTSPAIATAAVRVGVAIHIATIMARRLEALRRRAHRRRGHVGVGVDRWRSGLGGSLSVRIGLVWGTVVALGHVVMHGGE